MLQLMVSFSPCVLEHPTKKVPATVRELRAESEEREAALHEYYSQGSQYGVPASVVLFQLAHSMQLGCSYLLWYEAPFECITDTD